MPDDPLEPYRPPSPSQPVPGPGREADGLDEAVATVIPFKNPQALISYYLGLFSCIPVVGLILAFAALVLGVRGLHYRKANPASHGTAHAWVGLICGSIGLMLNLSIVGITILALLSGLNRR